MGWITHIPFSSFQPGKQARQTPLVLLKSLQLELTLWQTPLLSMQQSLAHYTHSDPLNLEQPGMVPEGGATRHVLLTNWQPPQHSVQTMLLQSKDLHRGSTSQQVPFKRQKPREQCWQTPLVRLAQLGSWALGFLKQMTSMSKQPLQQLVQAPVVESQVLQEELTGWQIPWLSLQNLWEHWRQVTPSVSRLLQPKLVVIICAQAREAMVNRINAFIFNSSNYIRLVANVLVLNKFIKIISFPKCWAGGILRPPDWPSAAW